MDSKKVILVLSLLAMVLLISSVVSARNLTETSFDTKKEVVEQAINVSPQYGKAPYGKSRGDPNNRGGYNPGNGGGGGGSPSNGGGGGGDPGNRAGGYPGNGGGGGGGSPGNSGGGGRYTGGGNYCRHKCCDGGYSSGRCIKCCDAGEPIDVQTEGNTHN